MKTKEEVKVKIEGLESIGAMGIPLVKGHPMDITEEQYKKIKYCEGKFFSVIDQREEKAKLKLDGLHHAKLGSLLREKGIDPKGMNKESMKAKLLELELA